MTPTENKKQLNILFLTRAWGNKAGGMERLNHEMIESLSRRNDVSATVLRPHLTTGNSLAMLRVKSALFAVSVIPKALISARKADVIHIGDPVLSAAGWLIKNIYRKPVLVTVHGLDIVYPNKIYQFYLFLFFRNLTAYLAISRHVQNVLKEKNVGGPSFLLTPGTHDNLYDTSINRSELNGILNMNTNSYCVLFTSGRLVRRKGHAWFLTNVLPKLPEKTIYVVAGSGPEEEKIREAVKNVGLEQKVVLLGRVSTHVLQTLYNTVDIFIQPNIKVSGDMEGYGLVLAEAALCRRTVIASELEGMTDAVNNGQNGILVEAENSNLWIETLKEYINDTDKRLQTGKQARKYTLNNLTWERLTDKYKEVFFKF